MKWFKKLIIKYYMWKLKRRCKNLQIAPQGQYFIKYIIDYYINETTDQKIDRYETQITALAERIKLPKTQNPIPDELKPAFLHMHAAIMALRTLLMMCPNKEEWLANINDNDIRRMVSNPLTITEEVQ